MAAAGKSFEATIGVQVKGDTWSCVEIPDSAEFFGTGKTVRVDVTVDDVKLENVGAMVTGTGGHMVSLSAATSVIAICNVCDLTIASRGRDRTRRYGHSRHCRSEIA